ncbi:MAG: GldG family protein [Clostridia bacterium]|nr:GldG family protein [Clostridia bacterium]
MSNNTKQTNMKTTKMGAYSAFLTLVVIAFVIVVNLMVGELPSTVTKFDTSSLKLYTLSNSTIQIVEGLNESVTMYYIVQNGTEDVNIEEMLNRYASYSSHVKIRKIDPTSNPGFSAKYTDDSLSNNSVIVESAKRSSVVMYEEIYTTQYTEEDYYNYYMTGVLPSGTTYFNGEGALTTAIDYVTADDLPVLYIVTGHGETDLSETVLADAKAENILTETLTLLTVTAIPDDAGAVILNAPTSDLTETERDVLLTYLDLGGKLILVTDYASFSDALMPNLAAVARAYGLKAEAGLVMEGNANNYMQYPFYLLPNVNASSDVAMNMTSTNITTILPFAHGITKIDGTDKYVEGVLTSSADAFVIPDINARVEEFADTDTPEKAYEKQDGDPSGTFYIAASAEDTVTGGKLLWVSSPFFVTDDFYSYNGELFMSALTMLCEKSSSISILGKAMQIQSLAVSSAAVAFWGAVLILVLPIGTVVLGFVIWNRRRKR